MFANNFLNQGQKEQLQKALRESNDPHLREGSLIMLLMNEGKTAREITDLLGCSYRTVAYWRFQGIPDNLENQPEPRHARSMSEEFISLADIRVLEETFTRVKSQSTKFAANFYNNLFTDYPEVRPLFAYTQMEAQEKKLMMALVLVINNLRNLAYLKTLLKDLGERHVTYGALREYYPMVGDTLLKTLASFFGTDWTAEVNQAWADGYEAIANLMLKEQ